MRKREAQDAGLDFTCIARAFGAGCFGEGLGRPRQEGTGTELSMAMRAVIPLDHDEIAY
jgi:hypothetical protein